MGEAGDGIGKLPGALEPAQVLVPALQKAGEDTLGMWQPPCSPCVQLGAVSPALGDAGAGLPPTDEQNL